MSMSVPSTCLAARSLPVAAARHLSACRSRAARGHVAPAQIARTIAAPSSPSPSSSSSRRRRHHVLTTAGWNDFEWGTASIVSNDAATPKGGLRSIVISVDASVAEGYVTPGQFVQMRTSEDGKPAFLAIASAPADVSSSSSAKTNELSLLVKSSDGTAGEICALEAGAEVGVSPAMGSGFDVSKAPADAYPTTLLFATGSGISPIRALITSGALKGRDVTLYYGTASGETTAFLDEFETWKKACGVREVKHVQSQVGGPPTYVQDQLKADLENVDGGKACAVLCGQKEMTEAVIEVLEGAGVPKERCIMNF